MSCECYKIGGPWISFDPECGEHGYAAQAKQRELEEATTAFEQRVDEAKSLEDLKGVVKDLLQFLRRG